MKKREVISNIIWFGSLVIVLLVIRNFIFMPVVVSGSSMAPNLQDHQRVIATKSKKFDRFDIVTFPAPDDPKKSYVKRIIGLPGDTVEYKNDQLFINNKKYDEPYLNKFKELLNENEYLTTAESNDGQIYSEFDLTNLIGLNSKSVPKGEVFVLGDNRKVSRDSRMIGFIKISDITGNVKFSIWPPKTFGAIN